MTDKTRAKLRRGIEALVRLVSAGRDSCLLIASSADPFDVGVNAFVDRDDRAELPHLTPFQQMCLAGLLGDPGQLEAAVVDYALDSGMDIVTAAYERGKAEERERCVKVCEDERERLWHEDYRGCEDEADGADRCADLIRGYSIMGQPTTTAFFVTTTPPPAPPPPPSSTPASNSAAA